MGRNTYRAFAASTELRQSYLEWLSTFEWDLAITINANKILTQMQQQHVLRQIDGVINREFRGPRYANGAEDTRVRIVGAPESKLSGVHFHIAVGIPNDLPIAAKALRSRRAVSGLLKPQGKAGLLPSASIHIQPCDVGWIGYVLKGVTHATLVYVRGLSEPTSSSS
jgi:hypothetical protein